MPYRPAPHIPVDKTLAAIHNRLDLLEDQVAMLERALVDARAQSESKPPLPLSGDIILPRDRVSTAVLVNDDQPSIDERIAEPATNKRSAPILAGAGLIAATLLVIEIAG